MDYGSFVPKARLQSNLANLMRKLIERIELMANKSNPVGDRVLGIENVTGNPIQIELSKEFNSEQVQAVESALGRNITFIWGPPGTGKTRTIGTIGAQLYRHSRSVLLVSHTNIAVDQALLRIGEDIDPLELAKGRVVRVGDPHDLRIIEKQPDLLLSTHVDRRAAELADRREDLKEKKEVASKEIIMVTRIIDICEWVSEANIDIEKMGRDLLDLQKLENILDETQMQLFQTEDEAEYWDEAFIKAQLAQRYINELNDSQRQLVQLNHLQGSIQTEIDKTVNLLAEAEIILDQAEIIEPLRARAYELPSLTKQTDITKLAQIELNSAKSHYSDTVRQLNEALALYSKTSSVGKLTRLWRQLPTPDEQMEKVEALRVEAASASQRVDEMKNAIAIAESVLREVAELSESLQQYSHLPNVESQRYVCKNLQNKIENLRSDLVDLQNRQNNINNIKNEIEFELNTFRLKYTGSPEDVIQKADVFKKKKEECICTIRRLKGECNERRIKITEILKKRFITLCDWGLTNENATSAEEILDAINLAYERARSQIEEYVLVELKAELKELNESIFAFEKEIEEIEESLKHIEDIVIAEATIVATTLTRAYLRDSIQSRRFDTVILDEASMAPIPALWVAASLADANAVVVGDFKQLPPIVMSTHDLAKLWLGRDIFEVAGLSNPESIDPRFIGLRLQYRMHPDISSISNTLVYENRLIDHEKTYGHENDDDLKKWYRQDWGYDHPVLLVDTGKVGAWVTSVSRGQRSSRLNFLSATICVDIAEQLLRDDRSDFAKGDQRRILIVCPYRPHAQLLGLLLKEQGLSEDALAGTAHSFQGSEADVVIVDLVNDEPHWRVAMFMSDYDKINKRLINVAFTRARRRLIIIGDFDYIAKQAKKAFLGRELIPYLRDKYPCRDALQIVPSGLAARAAKTHSSFIGGEVEPDACRIVVTQEHFYPILHHDILQAIQRVVIYFAFITQDRLAQLQPHFKAAIERGVRVYVITKAMSDRQKSEVAQYHKLKKSLEEWGIVVIHKRGMHEKLIFVDDEILWSGSLNPLSYSSTQEVMERRVNREVVSSFSHTLCL